MSKVWTPSRRVILAGSASLLAAPAIIRSASAQLSMMGVGGGRSAAGGGGTGTFASVSGVYAAGAGSGGTTTIVNDTTGAKLLVAAASYYPGGTFTGSGITDSKSNTWAIAGTDAASTNNGVRVWYSISPTVGSSHTVTIAGTNVFTGIAFASFSCTTTPSLDQQSQNSGTSASPTSTSITPSVNNGLVISVCGELDTGGFTGGAPSGFTLLGGTTLAANAGGYDGIGLAYLIQTTAAASAPTWTTSASNEFAVKMVSFKS